MNEWTKKYTHTQPEQNHRTKPWSDRNESKQNTEHAEELFYGVWVGHGEGKRTQEKRIFIHHYYRYLTIKWLSLAHKRTVIWVWSLRLCDFFRCRRRRRLRCCCCFFTSNITNWSLFCCALFELRHFLPSSSSSWHCPLHCMLHVARSEKKKQAKTHTYLL